MAIYVAIRHPRKRGNYMLVCYIELKDTDTENCFVSRFDRFCGSIKECLLHFPDKDAIKVWESYTDFQRYFLEVVTTHYCFDVPNFHKFIIQETEEILYDAGLISEK